MSRVRVFLFWLVMLAVPLQGFAAASMGLCGKANDSTRVAMADRHAEHATHASHEGHHAEHAQSAKAHHYGASATQEGASSHADGFHKCASCATCHAVALMSFTHIEQIHPLPQAELAEAPRAMATQVPRVPDKPPRA